MAGRWVRKSAQNWAISSARCWVSITVAQRVLRWVTVSATHSARMSARQWGYRSGRTSETATGQPSAAAGEQPTGAHSAAEPAWPAFGTADQSTMLFQTPANRVEHASYATKCAMWDDIGYEWVLKP